MKYSIDVVQTFNELYRIYGDDMYLEIYRAHDQMIEFGEPGQFFENTLRVDIKYIPTSRADTKLPLIIWDFFKHGDGRVCYPQDFFREQDDTDVLTFLPDVGELLLVMTGVIKL